MRKHSTRFGTLFAVSFWLLWAMPQAARALEPLVYTVRFPSPETHIAESGGF